MAAGTAHLARGRGPLGGQDIRLVVAFLQSLQREKASIRLKLVLTDSPSASSEQLETGKVDLAVVRSDIKLPEKAATVAIMRREAIYFVTRPEAKIAKIGDLKGKVIGVIGPRPANERILSAILMHYGMTDSDVTIVRGSQAEITQAMQDNKIDAFFAVAAGLGQDEPVRLPGLSEGRECRARLPADHRG